MSPPSGAGPLEEAASFERALARLEPLLLAESLDEVLERGAALTTGLLPTPVAALFLVAGAELGAEGWSADETTRARLRPHLRGLALEAARAMGDVVLPEGDGFVAVEGRVLAERGRTLGVLCFERPATIPAETQRTLDTLVRLLARQIAARQDAGATQATRARYERWFRQLDQHIRVLDRERQKFAAVVNQPDTYVFSADESRVIRWTNRALATRVPLSEGNWVGRPCAELWPRLTGSDETADASFCPVKHALETHQVAHREFQAAAEGTAHTLYVTALPIRNPEGMTHEVLVLVQDLTELESLQRAEQRLQTVIQHTPIVLFALDRNGVFTLSEGRGLEALGLRPGEAVGTSVWERYRDHPEILAHMRRAYAGEAHTGTVAVGDLEFETTYTPIRNHAGHVTGVIGVANDVSERRQLERQLIHAQRMEAVGRLAGGVAHDFNNLLTVILGHVELMIGRVQKGHPLRDPVEEIRKAGMRGALLTRQLLSFSRRDEAAPRTMDLNVVAAEMETLLRRVVGENVTLAFEPAAAPAPVRVDRGQIEQVFVNLTMHARDAMPQGGSLTLGIECHDAPPASTSADEWAIECAFQGPCVCVTVADDGRGLDQGDRQTLFEPFAARRGEGAALGLPLAYGIVRQSGGGMRVKSAPGRGTQVTVVLPRAAWPPEDDARAAGAAPSGANVATVLLVEDEPAVRALSRRGLEAAGFRVLEARDGEEALEIADGHQGRLDVVVTDVVMPNVGGAELVRRLSASHPAVRVLYVSGYDAVPDVPSTSCFLGKPFTPDVLVRQVREILDGSSEGSTSPPR